MRVALKCLITSTSKGGSSMEKMGPNSLSKDPSPAGVLERGILVAIMRILSLVRAESGLAKRIRLL